MPENKIRRLRQQFRFTMRTSVVIAVLVTAMGCQRERSAPSRDHIPMIKAQVFRLQNAVKSGNRAAIDSLASIELLDAKQSSDSLLTFIFGPQGNYPFGRLADVQIAYTATRARVDCTIVDTLEKQRRPLVLTFTLVDSTWLLKRFDTDTSGRPSGKLRDSASN